VLLSHHSRLRYRLEELFARRRVVPNVVLETPQSTIACALVAAGAGITLVSRVAAASYAWRNVAVRPLKDRVTSDFALIYPVVGGRSRLVEVLAAELRAEIRSLLA